MFLPDRGHIHHRLLDLGLSHRNAVLVLYGVGTLFALSAFSMVLIKSRWVGLLLVAVLAAAMASFVGLLYFRIRRSGRSEPVPVAEEGQQRVPKDRSLASQGG